MKNKPHPYLTTPEQQQFQHLESRAESLAWITLFLFAVAEVVLARI